jgi:hypothetical protein
VTLSIRAKGFVSKDVVVTPKSDEVVAAGDAPARLGASRACLRDALDLTRPATNLQGNGPAANAAIFDQGLLGLRRVDLQRERFTAVRTNDLCLVNQFHSETLKGFQS